MDFANYWQYTDIVTKFIFFMLIFLSIVSWLVGVLKIIHTISMKNNVESNIQNAIKAKAISTHTTVKDTKTITEQLLLQQIARFRYQGELGLSILGTTASIAPFLGLFGTVWGIFHALQKIGDTSQAGLDMVAGPVGEALIMTGLGIAVAIPAVIFYNVIVRLNRRVLFKANDIAYSILTETIEGNN